MQNQCAISKNVGCLEFFLSDSGQRKLFVLYIVLISVTPYKIRTVYKNRRSDNMHGG